MIHDKQVIASGEERGGCASEAAAASEEGSRRANCPVLTEGGLCASVFMLRCVARVGTKTAGHHVSGGVVEWWDVD